MIFCSQIIAIWKMATSSGSREKVFTNIDEILDIVLDNNDESGNGLDIGGSDNWW